MGDIGHQIATHLLVALQGAGELVKILRQAAELIAACHRHAGGKVARRQLMGAFHQPLHRRQQTAGQRESGQRGKQGGKGDNQPAGALLLPVEVNVGIARQPLYRRGDHFAHLRAVDHDAALGAVLRDALSRPHQHAPRLIHHPEHGAPAVGRHFRPRARAVRGPSGGGPSGAASGFMACPGGERSSLSRSKVRSSWKIKRSLLRRNAQLPCWAYCSLSASLSMVKRCSLPRLI